MKRMNYYFLTITAALLAVTFMASSAFAQVTWQTTHTSVGGYNSGVCDLNHSTLKVSVYPAYLDVEEDVEIAPTGQVSIGNDAKTLEITGDFSLPPGAAITGALLWDGPQILQGKLLDRGIADSLYNSLVERNSAPPPRPLDPLIIEATGKNTYRFRIYPCVPGMNRHFRLRYQLAPTLGVEGLEIPFQAAITSLFPSANITVPVTIVNGKDIPKALFVSPGDLRVTFDLPKTKLMTPASLAGQLINYDMWGNPTYSFGNKILPIDPQRQVAVKTNFKSGNMAGEYLNLYAGVTDQILSGLHQKVEVVIYWKWHNPGTWIINDYYGGQTSGSVWQAQNQASVLYDLYNQLGGVGNRVGLLHDDSKIKPHAYAVAARGEPNYLHAQEYLRSIAEQGNFVEEFARGIKVLRTINTTPLKAHIDVSKNRFITNLRLIKTLYSPDSGIVRHLLVVSAGVDFLIEDNTMNLQLDSIFGGKPISIASMGGFGFSQAGFDFAEAKRTHLYKGISVSTPWGNLPGLPELNLSVTVKNEKKAYDFDISCGGGLSVTCGSLTFHGKSNEPWNDTLSWLAFDKAGKAIGQTVSVPKIIQSENDTATAILWAGSDNPFSEKKELPLGPIYGFVDRWASLLSLTKDSIPKASAAAYADTGVPRIATHNLKDVIPNYVDGAAPNSPQNPGCQFCTNSLSARLGELSNSGAWRIERGHANALLIHIPGLSNGVDLQLEIFDLEGKRVGQWSLKSQTALVSLNVGHLHPGMYLLKIRVGEVQGIKRLAL